VKWKAAYETFQLHHLARRRELYSLPYPPVIPNYLVCQVTLTGSVDGGRHPTYRLDTVIFGGKKLKVAESTVGTPQARLCASCTKPVCADERDVPETDYSAK
jgi:hypothetical protein